MKQVFIATIALLFLSKFTYAQTTDLPSTKVRDLKGKSLAFKDAFEKGKITLVSFWATWCVPCKAEINNIKGKLDTWKKEVDFNYITVSIDDSRAAAMVKTYTKSKGWNFNTYLDPNSDLKRALNFQNVPFTIIVDKNGKIVYQHTGYEEGGENDLFERIKALK